MNITINAIGKIKEKYLQTGISEFLKRLKPYCNLTIIEHNEEKMPENPSLITKTLVIDKEGEKLLKSRKKYDFKIALDVKGESFSSEELASLLSKKALEGKSNIIIFIGGAYGLSHKIKTDSDISISFSKMTFTHQMIRLLLVEQIYRAFKIINNEKYHN